MAAMAPNALPAVFVAFILDRISSGSSFKMLISTAYDRPAGKSNHRHIDYCYSLL